MIGRYFTKGDIVIIAAFLCLSVMGLFAAGRFGMGGKHVVVEVDGRRYMEIPLDRDTHEAVTGPLGNTVIVVENGEVHIDSSPCPNQHCVHMGSISHCGELLVCVPNRVVVSIKGGGEAEQMDGVTQ